jgi:hypothetical protein
MQDVDNFNDNVRKRVAKLDENLVSTTKRSTSEFNMVSPPFLRNSLGIPSSPTAFPLARFFKEVSIDARENLNENISIVGTKFSSNLATLLRKIF